MDYGGIVGILNTILCEYIWGRDLVGDCGPVETGETENHKRILTIVIRQARRESTELVVSAAMVQESPTIHESVSRTVKLTESTP